MADYFWRFWAVFGRFLGVFWRFLAFFGVFWGFFIFLGVPFKFSIYQLLLQPIFSSFSYEAATSPNQL